MDPVDGSDELIELAAVMRSHGLRGELLLKPFNPESTLLLEVERVFLKAPDGSVRRFEVESARDHSGLQLLALEGVNSREEGDPLRGHLVCVPRADLPPPEEGEHYLVDLVGLAARDVQGQPVGTIEEVIEYPSVVCFAVVGPEGTREVPNLPRYVTNLDVAGGFVVVDNLEELELEKPKAR